MIIVLLVSDERLSAQLAERGAKHVNVWACPCPDKECNLRVACGWGKADDNSRIFWAAQNTLLVQTPSAEALAAALSKHGFQAQLYGVRDEAGVRQIAKEIVATEHVDSLVNTMLGSFRQLAVARA